MAKLILGPEGEPVLVSAAEQALVIKQGGRIADNADLSVRVLTVNDKIPFWLSLLESKDEQHVASSLLWLNSYIFNLLIAPIYDDLDTSTVVGFLNERIQS